MKWESIEADETNGRGREKKPTGPFSRERRKPSTQTQKTKGRADDRIESGESVTRSRTMCYKKKADEKAQEFLHRRKKKGSTDHGRNGGDSIWTRRKWTKLIGGRMADATWNMDAACQDKNQTTLCVISLKWKRIGRSIASIVSAHRQLFVLRPACVFPPDDNGNNLRRLVQEMWPQSPTTALTTAVIRGSVGRCEQVVGGVNIFSGASSRDERRWWWRGRISFAL